MIPIKALSEGIKAAWQLRDAGIKTDIDSTGKSPSKNLEYANSLGIPYAIFVGKKELEAGKLKLRDMESGKEELLSIERAIELLKNVK